MKTLTREEVVNLSLLLHKADEEGALLFDRIVENDGCIAHVVMFLNSGCYMSGTISIPGDKMSFGAGTIDEQYVEHIMGTHEFCPELVVLCDWIKERAEAENKPTASTKELAKLINGWVK